MSEYTKTPWKVTGKHFVDAPIGGGRLQEVSWCGDVEHGDREANARHIVRCVNNHERLVELLKDGQNVWGEYLTTGGGSPVAHSKFVKAARKFMDDSQALLAALEAGKGGEL